MTMTLISTVSVPSGGQAAIEFLSIPQSFTDLYLTISGRSSSTVGIAYLEFNGLTTNLSSRLLNGDGSAPDSTNYTTIRLGARGLSSSDYTSNTFGSISVYIPNYTASTNKSVSYDAVSENNATTAFQTIGAGLWSSTAAITSLKIDVFNTDLFVQNSTASLYGILKGSGGATVS